MSLLLEYGVLLDMSDTLNFVLRDPNDAADKIEALETRLKDSCDYYNQAVANLCHAADRIEALEAALREIVAKGSYQEKYKVLAEIARAALDKDTQ